MHPIQLKSIAIKHYSRQIISNAIAEESKDREVAVRYSYGFGKRPEMVDTSAEVRQFGNQGASSFHISEELWNNPLDIITGMSEKEYNQIRKGWDLIIDIDAPDWRFCKVVCATMIEVLKDFGIKTIRVKFSGNKGFHIGIPWEAFPKQVMYNGNMTELSNLFPQAPREIAKIMIREADEKYITIDNDGKIIFLGKHVFERKQITQILSLQDSDLLLKKCQSCKRIYEDEKSRTFECPNCMRRTISDKEYEKCNDCNIEMTVLIQNPRCVCGNTTFISSLNVEKILHLDTLLISQRHLFRSPYSIHEKSGLCSIPIKPEIVLEFEKEYAKPEYIEHAIPFINEEVRNQASITEGEIIIRKALDNLDEPVKEIKYEEIEVPDKALGKEYYPPCINNALQGLKDGKKRTLLIFTSYLRSIGWNKDMAEKIIYAWNEKNEEPLREVYIKGQLRHAFSGKIVLPPNCDHKDYMKDIGICTPDEFCGRIKNPAQYSKRKYEIEKLSKKAKRSNKTKDNSSEKPEKKKKNLKKEKKPEEKEVQNETTTQ